MISPLRLEQDGHWRSAGLAICFLPVFAVVTMLGRLEKTEKIVR